MKEYRIFYDTKHTIIRIKLSSNIIVSDNNISDVVKHINAILIESGHDPIFTNYLFNYLKTNSIEFEECANTYNITLDEDNNEIVIIKQEKELKHVEISNED